MPPSLRCKMIITYMLQRYSLHFLFFFHLSCPWSSSPPWANHSVDTCRHPWWDLHPTLWKVQILFVSLQYGWLLDLRQQDDCGHPCYIFPKCYSRPKRHRPEKFHFCWTTCLSTRPSSESCMQNQPLLWSSHQFPRKQTAVFSSFHNRCDWRHPALVSSCQPSFVPKRLPTIVLVSQNHTLNLPPCPANTWLDHSSCSNNCGSSIVHGTALAIDDTQTLPGTISNCPHILS